MGGVDKVFYKGMMNMIYQDPQQGVKVTCR